MLQSSQPCQPTTSASSFPSQPGFGVPSYQPFGGAPPLYGGYGQPGAGPPGAQQFGMPAGGQPGNSFVGLIQGMEVYM